MSVQVAEWARAHLDDLQSHPLILRGGMIATTGEFDEESWDWIPICMLPPSQKRAVWDEINAMFPELADHSCMTVKEIFRVVHCYRWGLWWDNERPSKFTKYV